MERRRVLARRRTAVLVAACASVSASPAAATPAPPAISVTAGWQHNCAVLADHTARCWGYNGHGELGNGTSNNFSLRPVIVSGLGDAVSISAGDGVTCALRLGGAASCWGDGEFGALGNGSDQPTSTPVPVYGMSTASALDVGFDGRATCAVLASGSGECWGIGYVVGQHTLIPAVVNGLSGAEKIDAGDGFACALLHSGHVLCWGDNTWGELGNGGTYAGPTPTPVTGLSDAVALATGYDHACAVRATGGVVCWGNNLWGALGSNLFLTSNVPFPVPGVAGAVTVGAGFHHSCAVLANGRVDCWGEGSQGELGTGYPNTNTWVPQEVIGLTNIVAVSAGWYSTCALGSDGAVWCWGTGSIGQLGNGQQGGLSFVPVRVNLDSDGSPPTITRTISGIAGAHGWYTSAVTVTWQVTDPESTVVVDEGCGTQTLSTDSVAVTSTCRVHSDGGQASDSVTLRIDRTPPVVTLGVVGGTPGANGIYTGPVTIRTSGVESVSSPISCTADQTQSQSTNGTLFDGSCTNDAGLVGRAASLTVRVTLPAQTPPPPSTRTPAPAPAPGPRDTPVERGPGGKGFRIQVVFTVPKSCGRPCTGIAELRTRTGARLYRVTIGPRLKGDGKILLGHRSGIPLLTRAGKQVRFYLTVSKAALLRTPFHTSGSFRLAETRLRVMLHTATGDRLYVRDGHIKVSIPRIRSGALPGLEGIL